MIPQIILLIRWMLAACLIAFIVSCSYYSEPTITSLLRESEAKEMAFRKLAYYCTKEKLNCSDLSLVFYFDQDYRGLEHEANPRAEETAVDKSPTGLELDPQTALETESAVNSKADIQEANVAIKASARDAHIAKKDESALKTNTMPTEHGKNDVSTLLENSKTTPQTKDNNLASGWSFMFLKPDLKNGIYVHVLSNAKTTMIPVGNLIKEKGWWHSLWSFFWME